MKELIPRPAISVNRNSVELALLRLMRQPSQERLRTAMRMVEEYAATLHTSRVYARADELVTKAFVDAAAAKHDGYELVFCVQMQDVPEFFKFFGPDAGFIKKFFYEGREARLPARLAEVDGARTICTQNDRVPTVCVQNVCVPDEMPDVIEPSVVEPPVYEPVVDEPSVSEPLTERTFTEPGSKTCRRCSQVLPLDQFTRHRGRADGYESSCQRCERARKNMRRAPVREGQGPA